MIEFADSHVDLMGSVTFSSAQLTRRWDQELGKKWRPEVQNNLRDFKQMKPELDPETFPNYAANDAMLSEFSTDKQTCYGRMMVDMGKNNLLIQAIAYENAMRRKGELELRLFGREAEPEIPEEQDPETGLVTQPYVPAIEAVEPLPATVELDGQTVDNPEYLSVAGELQQIDDLIANASLELQDLVSSRQAISLS